MSHAIPCPACGSDTADGLLCRVCASRLRHDLRELPGLMDELRVTLTRQSQAGTGNGGHGAEDPLPYDANASEVRANVGNTLSTWMRELAMDDLWLDRCTCAPYRACPGRIPLPNTTRAWCEWLERRIDRIRIHEASAEIADEIHYQVGEVRSAIDLPPEREFCGKCPICSRDILARPGAEKATCGYCARAGIESVLHVASARDELWERAEDKLIPRRLIMQVLDAYDLPVKPVTWRKWIERGQLHHEEISASGAPLYRLRRVVDLAWHSRHEAPEITCWLCWARGCRTWVRLNTPSEAA